jgi:hypothetical protein
VFISWNQNTGRSHNIKTDNISFERVEQFRYLGTTLTALTALTALTTLTALMNQNFIPEEIKSRLKSENAFCHLVQNLLSFYSLSKYMKTKIHRTQILTALYGCETWLFTLK